VAELMEAKGGAIVEIDLSGESSFAQSLHKTVGEVFEVLLKIELLMGNQTGITVKKSKEKALSDLPFNHDDRTVHAVRLPEIIGEFGFIASETRFDSLGFVEVMPLKEPIEALDGGAKVRRQKLSFPSHPEDHGQRGLFEFFFEAYQSQLRLFIQRPGSPFIRMLLRLQTLQLAATVLIPLEPLQNR